MSTNRGVDIGTASESFNGWTTTEVRFNRFADLPATRGEYVESPEFSCFGHRWRLSLFPGGRADSEEGYVAIVLGNMSNTSAEIQWRFNVTNGDGKEVVSIFNPNKDEFGAYGCQPPQNSAYCYANVSRRSTILDALVNGS